MNEPKHTIIGADDHVACTKLALERVQHPGYAAPNSNSPRRSAVLPCREGSSVRSGLSIREAVEYLTSIG